jgi:hypothetical protein
MVRVTGRLVPAPFVAVRVTIVTAAAVGMPVMAPVAALTASPAGSGLAV